jgi:hypothetical protein
MLGPRRSLHSEADHFREICYHWHSLRPSHLQHEIKVATTVSPYTTQRDPDRYDPEILQISHLQYSPHWKKPWPVTAMLVVALFVPFFSPHFLFISAGASASASCTARGRDSSLGGVKDVMAAVSGREASASAVKT